MPGRPEIALLGGSFNPPHVAHVMAAWWALASSRASIEEIWRSNAARRAARSLRGVSRI